jgi:hypothetical protein
MAELIEIGFDSFTEEIDGILGYIQKDLFNEDQLKALPIFENENVKIEYSLKKCRISTGMKSGKRIFLRSILMIKY